VRTKLGFSVRAIHFSCVNYKATFFQRVHNNFSSFFLLVNLKKGRIANGFDLEAFSMSAKHVIPITKKRGKIILPRKNGENHRFVIKN